MAFAATMATECLVARQMDIIYVENIEETPMVSVPFRTEPQSSKPPALKKASFLSV